MNFAEFKKHLTDRLAKLRGAAAASIRAVIGRARSMDDMREELEVARSRSRHELDKLDANMDRLYAQIVEARKEYESGAPHKRLTRAALLRGLLREYDGMKERAAVLARNYELVAGVLTKLDRAMSTAATGLPEDLVDEVFAELEEAVDDNEGATTAGRELADAFPLDVDRELGLAEIDRRLGELAPTGDAETDLDRRLREFDAPKKTEPADADRDEED